MNSFESFIFEHKKGFTNAKPELLRKMLAKKKNYEIKAILNVFYASALIPNCYEIMPKLFTCRINPINI